jgi:hypothetical protein
LPQNKDEIVLPAPKKIKYHRIIVIDAHSKRLVDLVTVRTGYPFRGPLSEVPSGGALVTQMKDVDPGSGLSWSSVVRAELPGRKEPDWLQAGDILFVPRGQRFFAVSIDEPPAPSVCGPHLMLLRLRSGAPVSARFLAWQINQPPVQKQLRAAAEGSSQLSVRISEIEDLEVAVPPVDQQGRIVALADAAARERQALAQLILNREQTLASIAADLATAAGLEPPGSPRP